jgi:hypothetical protein
MKSFTILIIAFIVLSFLLVAGCTQSSTSVQYRDDELINAIFNSEDKLITIMNNAGSHANNQEWAEMEIDSQNLESEARAQYDKIDKITPISPDLTTAKQRYLTALGYVEEGGRIGQQVADAGLRGNISEVENLGYELTKTTREAANYFDQTNDALPERYKSGTESTLTVTAVKTSA